MRYSEHKTTGDAMQIRPYQETDRPSAHATRRARKAAFGWRDTSNYQLEDSTARRWAKRFG